MSVPLSSLALGQAGTVVGFLRDDTVTRRLMQMGVIEDTQVRLLRRAPTGDPIEIEVIDYALSLRLDEADAILVQPEPE